VFKVWQEFQLAKRTERAREELQQKVTLEMDQDQAERHRDSFRVFIPPDFFITVASFNVLAVGSFRRCSWNFLTIKYGAEIWSARGVHAP
jgi:hypothetical protein